jgi:hypothetical protein
VEEAGAPAAAALAALARRAEALRLPPAALPGWSSLCAAEYSAVIAELSRHVAALRAALAAAGRAAGGP